MDGVELAIVGAAVGFVAYQLWKKSKAAAYAPVVLPAGQAFGPPVPTGDAPVVPGPINLAEGLA